MSKDENDWPNWPYFDPEMLEAASAVLKSGKVNYWSGDIHHLEDGTDVRGENGLFEYEFANYHSSKYAIALANGSLALELALLAYGIGPGDEVITTSRTFIASASCVAIQGALPRFADIDRESQNLSAETIFPLMNKKTRAIIPVHLSGRACEMDEILSLVREKEKEYGHRIYIIEDCAQALGGEYKSRKLGTMGDAGCFSFCQDKIITTGGEGGMLILNDETAYRKAWSYKDHGKNFDRYNLELKHPLAAPERENTASSYSSVGSNWRMTEMQAALGRVALKKLDNWNLKNRRINALYLEEALNKINGIKVYSPPKHISHAYYKQNATITGTLKADWPRERLINECNAKGLPCTYGSLWGISTEDAWKKIRLENGIEEAILANDIKIGQSNIMFQVHPTLTVEHMQATARILEDVMSQAID
ncbi:MAG: DegT/DnrJ/EryC1/StrS aminotransferase family protein [Lentisphaeria bacterium]|nr:DegT/DnrJ/EryC1/StrS aminotransferase family protein [Lentisphaeria bacterium]NQZ70419.1 DegT/DnrJ/EryC1/StrS aminotransferase family protein [Lentisphaeria bacterium]